MSLRTKTIIGIAAIEAVMLVLLVTTVLHYMHGSSEEELIQRASTTASLFATSTKNPVLSYDLASLDAFSKEVVKNPGIVYARVLGADGELLSEAGVSGTPIEQFVADTSLADVRDGVFDTFAVIEEGGANYGRVELGISTESIHVALTEARKLAGGIALIEMSLVALFSFILGTYLTSKLKTLHKAARRISRGDFESKIPIDGKGEVAEVAGALNRMIDKLKMSNDKRDEYERELELLNETLEGRVQRRTAALEEKNKELTDAYEEVKRAQSQALQSEKMASVGQLAAGVAHEINNPVGFVSSNLDSLREYVETYQLLISKYEAYLQGDDSLRQQIDREIKDLCEREDIEFIHEDINSLLGDSIEGTVRVREIVQGLKEFSHVDGGERQPADINKCIDSTLKVANNELKYKCEVITDFADIPQVSCNPGQLNQVFLNLFVNAAHAMQEKGTITVSSRLEGDDVVVIVSDNGRGIPEKNLDKLFEPFFTTKPVGKGTGLGLSIAYGIIQDHNGDISVKSREGVGTEFQIRLPIDSSNNSEAA